MQKTYFHLDLFTVEPITISEAQVKRISRLLCLQSMQYSSIENRGSEVKGEQVQHKIERREDFSGELCIAYEFLTSHRFNSVPVEHYVLFYVYCEICGRVRENESTRGWPYLSREPELHKKVNKREIRRGPIISLLSLLTSNAVRFMRYFQVRIRSSYLSESRQTIAFCDAIVNKDDDFSVKVLLRRATDDMLQSGILLELILLCFCHTY